MGSYVASAMQEIVPLPDNLTILTDRDAVVIRRRWFSPVVFFLVVFALFWNGFMVVWMSIALSQGAWMMAAFGSIHTCVGLGLIYFCVASFMNQTDVSVDPSFLRVQHHPLPWPGKRKIPVHEIRQLYTKEHVSRNKNSVSVSYAVYVVTEDGREQKLLAGLTTDSQARYIEREIESILGLANIPVAGEHRG